MKNKLLIPLILISILIVECMQPLTIIRATEVADENTTSQEDFSSNSLIVETDNIEEIEKDSNTQNVVEVAEGIYIVDYVDEDVADEKLEDLSNAEYVNEVFKDIEITISENELETQAVNKNRISWGVQTTGMDHYTDYLNYKSSKKLSVAVLDTGINAKHEVFASSSTADRIDTTYSYNYVSNSKNVTDDNGHGTMVASVIAESTPTNVKIVPVKIANNKGKGSLANMMEAIANLKDNVDIINLSMGIETSEIDSSSMSVLEGILKSIYNNGKGPVIVCAAGNNGKAAVDYPASSSYTVGVSALKKDSSGNLSIASFSNYGSKVDFAAPGNLLTLANYSTNNGYTTDSGTSFASPYVAAAAALVKIDNSLSTVNAVKEKLKANADDLGTSGKDVYYGYGSINFITNMFEVPAIANVKVTSNNITVNAVCDDNIVKYACVKSGRNVSNSDWKTISNASTKVTLNFSISGSGTYIVYLRDSEGQTSSKVVTAGSTTVTEPSVKYRTHVQNKGWQNYVSNGATSGTTGSSLRLEGIRVSVQSPDISGGITYRTHVQDVGWQSYVSNDALSGTTGRSLRLEAIQIKLTGNLAETYDVYYRVHCQNFGWMGWAKNGESSGSAGFGYRLEAIQIKLVKKGNSAPGSTKNRFRQNISYRTHVQDIGWKKYVNAGEVSGTTGRSLRLEAIRIKIENSDISGNVEYSTHVQNIGWQNFVRNNAMAGTSGRSLRLEAIKIRLTGNLASNYDIYYRVHCQNIGWMGWVKNGDPTGTVGLGYRLEGIQIMLLNKGDNAP